MVTRILIAAAAMALLATGVGSTPAQAAYPVQITKILVNAPGTDTKANVNGEYIQLKNFGTVSRTLSRFTITDAAGNKFAFPTFTLGAGKTVTIYTGTGTNSSTRLYWKRSWHVWNNSGGDKAIFRSSAGTLLDSCGWSGSVAVKYC